MKKSLLKSNIAIIRYAKLNETLYYLVFLFFFFILSCSGDKILDENVIEEIQETLSSNEETQNVADSSISLTSDFIINEGLFKHSLARRLSSVPGQSAYDVATWNRLNSLGLVQARVWLRFKYIYNVTTKTPNYTSYQTYMDNWNNGASSLYLNWRSDYEELMASGNWTYNELLAAQTDALTHFKTRYPNIEFIEAENELMDTYMTVYYASYKLINQAVNAVNAKNLPGVQLKIGGPTTSAPSTWYIGKFLDNYTNDTDPNKKLDFISYHQYLFNDTKDNPAQVATERSTINSLLSARGLPALPVYISETGIFQVDVSSPLGLPADYNIQAAGITAMYYFYVNQPNMYPFSWTVRHPTNPRKNLFVDYLGGVPRPFYNALEMMTMLPNTRFSSTTSLDVNGLGVGTLAGGTSTKVAVLSWNYQWVNPTSFSVDLLLKNLPEAFKIQNVRVERYLLDSNQQSGELMKFEDAIYPAFTSGEYRATFMHNPNAIRLIVLTAQPIVSGF